MFALVQGADTVIFERLSDGNNPYKEATREHLEKFGADGLRTLCLAYRQLDDQEYDFWNEKFIQAKSALRDREKKLDEVAFGQVINIGLSLFVLLPGDASH